MPAFMLEISQADISLAISWEWECLRKEYNFPPPESINSVFIGGENETYAARLSPVIAFSNLTPTLGC